MTGQLHSQTLNGQPDGSLQEMTRLALYKVRVKSRDASGQLGMWNQRVTYLLRCSPEPIRKTDVIEETRKISSMSQIL